MFTPFKLKNPLTFPGNRLPGFDPTHPALANATTKPILSCINSGAGFVQLTTGAPATYTVTSGTATNTIDVIGPVTTFSHNASISATWTGAPAQPNASFGITFAIIFRQLESGSGFDFGLMFANSGSGNGVRLDSFNTSPCISIPNVGNFVATNLTITANVPYFIVASGTIGNPGTYDCVQTNLATGQVSSQRNIAINSTPLAAAGANWGVGFELTGAGTPNCNIAAASISFNVLPFTTMLAWAADPWSFWYPPVLEEIIESSLAPFISVGPPPVFVLMPQIVT
jgi:hypothetical protein